MSFTTSFPRWIRNSWSKSPTVTIDNAYIEIIAYLLNFRFISRVYSCADAKNGGIYLFDGILIRRNWLNKAHSHGEYCAPIFDTWNSIYSVNKRAYIDRFVWIFCFKFSQQFHFSSFILLQLFHEFFNCFYMPWGYNWRCFIILSRYFIYFWLFQEIFLKFSTYLLIYVDSFDTVKQVAAANEACFGQILSCLF